MNNLNFIFNVVDCYQNIHSGLTSEYIGEFASHGEGMPFNFDDGWKLKIRPLYYYGCGPDEFLVSDFEWASGEGILCLDYKWEGGAIPNLPLSRYWTFRQKIDRILNKAFTWTKGAIKGCLNSKSH